MLRGIFYKVIIRKLSKNEELRGIILETAAYEGGKMTESRKGMLYAPGTIF